MHSLSDTEVDFILGDLEKKGIVLEELRDNLLDHICCILEDEMEEQDDFHEYYESILPRFFNNELIEIQKETDKLLQFKNFYIMKKIMYHSGAITALLTLLGALFKSMHWPGAGLLIMLGGFFFSIVFMPLLIILKLRDDESKREKLVFSFGLLLSIGLITGVLFKIMHWPFANNLMLYSTGLFIFLYVPVYFITGIRRPERKFYTIVNSVLMVAIGGIFYSMFDLGYSKQYLAEMKKDHVYLHENSEKLLLNNTMLVEKSIESEQSYTFYELSRSINNAVEDYSKQIMQQQSTKSLMSISKEFDEKVNRYNIQLQSLEVDQLAAIDLEPIHNLYSFKPELAMNVLARLQQQLAVNETCYFSKLVSNNPASQK